jgi:hypothetical protein
MNLTVVFLGIIIVILIFVLYKYMYPTNAVLSKSAVLNTGPLPIITNLNNATSQRYALSIWVYVNNWENNKEKVIYSRKTASKTYYALSIDATAPTLRYKIGMDNGTVEDMIITDNFPIQKWVCIMISVDNQFIDAYIDGKLVKSQRAYIPASGGNPSVMPANQPISDVGIQLGSGGTISTNSNDASTYVPFDAYVTQFTRWDTPVDPQLAWSIYINGNGQSGWLSSFSTFGATLSILKNNIEYSKLTLF